MSSAYRSICEQIENHTIIYDAQLAGQISVAWFDPEYWRGHAEVQAVGAGRGQAWFIEAAGQAYVLRHYRRGGLAAKLTTDRYLWTGLMRTRAWREYQLLVKLQELGLPAPRPVAARVRQYGWFYSADLLTWRIPDSQPLSHILMARALDETSWRRIGECIRRFHRHDIYHADLNAHNILLDDSGYIYLIDFDKSGVDQDKSWQQRSLQRLQRSFIKLQTQDSHFRFTDVDWRALLVGYNS